MYYIPPRPSLKHDISLVHDSADWAWLFCFLHGWDVLKAGSI